jgi:hypothetical protein
MTDTSGPAVSLGIKDAGICLAWIAGLLLVGVLSWFLTRDIRADTLMRAVNRVLMTSEDPRRFGDPLLPAEIAPGKARLGSWYRLVDSDGLGLIFSVMHDGISASCAAVISGQGKVEALIPLNSHGSRVLERLPPGVLRAYIRRIEEGP